MGKAGAHWQTVVEEVPSELNLLGMGTKSM